MAKIYALKQGNLNEADRLELARLLLKAGYVARLGREKLNPKSSTYKNYVEYWEKADG